MEVFSEPPEPGLGLAAVMWDWVQASPIDRSEVLAAYGATTLASGLAVDVAEGMDPDTEKTGPSGGKLRAAVRKVHQRDRAKRRRKRKDG